ncbi:MAG: hypothetical protein JWO46_1806 [Nocardioidaceae bacterium]|nr:hypothetical protein [Nocardioidaceae bacterium]
MTALVRVYDQRLKSEISVAVVDRAYQEVLADKPATDVDGKPLAAKLRQSLAANVDGPSAWADKTVPELKAAIDDRNGDRMPADHIVVEEPGNKPELVAALSADDAEQPPAPMVDEDAEDRYVPADQVELEPEGQPAAPLVVVFGDPDEGSDPDSDQVEADPTDDDGLTSDEIEADANAAAAHAALAGGDADPS